jgi:hypothetical protein
MYFALAPALFPDLSRTGVWQQLNAFLGPLAPKVSETALRHLLRRLTPAPFKALFETLAVPLATPDTPGVRHLAGGTRVSGRYRLATTLLDPTADPADRLT